MPFQDWAIVEEIEHVKAVYAEAGIPLAGCYQHLIPIDFGTIGAGGGFSSPLPVAMPADSDFLWLGNMLSPTWSITVNGYTNPAAAALIRIEHVRTGRRLGNHRDLGTAGGQWIPPANIAGSAKNPFMWPAPMLLKAKEQLKFDVVNRGNAALTLFRFTLLGLRLEIGGRAAA